MTPDRRRGLSSRPAAQRGQIVAGWLQTLRFRYRAIRWIAAAGAAIAAFTALSSNTADPGGASEPDPEALLSQQPAERLPPLTRGVTIPEAGATLRVGDTVDVHEIRTGAPVAVGALIVDVADEDAVVAVPAELGDPLVDALTTGGVIVALVPHPTPAP